MPEKAIEQKTVFLKVWLVEPWGFLRPKSYLLSNTKTCAFFTILTFVLMVQKQKWVKLQVGPHESRQWPPTVLEVRLLLTSTPYKKPVSLKNVLVEAAQMINSVKSPTSSTSV